MTDSIPTKRCSKCGVEYPATTEHFRHRPQNKDGLGRCHNCARDYEHQYRKANLERVREKEHRYRKVNPEKMAAKSLRWQRANPEKRNEKTQRWRKANPEKVRANGKLWDKNNPEKRRVIKRNRKIRQRNTEGSHTAADIKAQYEAQEGYCFYCGITLHDDYHVDHVVPLARGGTNWPDNLVCACKRCNIEKNAKLYPDEWTPTSQSPMLSRLAL